MNQVQGIYITYEKNVLIAVVNDSTSIHKKRIKKNQTSKKKKKMNKQTNKQITSKNTGIDFVPVFSCGKVMLFLFLSPRTSALINLLICLFHAERSNSAFSGASIFSIKCISLVSVQLSPWQPLCKHDGSKNKNKRKIARNPFSNAMFYLY